MTDVALGQLRFADYSVNLGSVPTKFDVSPESLLLANSVIPNHSFKVENEVRAQRRLIDTPKHPPQSNFIVFYF